MNYLKHIFLATLCLLAFGGVVLAEPTSERRVQVKERIQEIKLRASSTRPTGSSTREDAIDRVCAKLASRIDNRITHFGERYDVHLITYNLHKEKLLNIEAKLSGQGIDTTKLKANISTLDVKISTFINDAGKVREALENTRNFSCGNSEGQFRSAVESLRVAQKVVIKDAQDIRDFITNTLMSDIKELRTITKNTNEKQQ